MSASPDPVAADRTGDPRSRVVVLGVLVLVVVVCLGLLGWLYVSRTEASQGTVGARVAALLQGGDPVQDDRDEVMSQAGQFMLRVNTYGPDLLDDAGQMPEYRAGVEEVITPTFKASFDQGVTAAEQTVAQAGLARSAEVFSTGVGSLDGDSARVLVAGSFVNSYPDPRGKDETARIKDEPAPFRVEVALVRTGGQWLVDDFVPVTGAPTQTPGSSPSGLPTPRPGGQGPQRSGGRR